MSAPTQYLPERIAVAGDWHGNADFAGAAIARAARSHCEGIVHTGDFGIWPGEFGRRFLRSVDAALAKHHMWQMFVDGNHEDHWQLNSLPIQDDGLRQVAENIWHIPRAHRWVWGDRVWMGLGGAVSLDRKVRDLGRSWWPEETISYADIQRARSGPVDVMVTHDCPAGVTVPNLPPDSVWDPQELANATTHREILASICADVRPDLLYHGHFHSRYSGVVRLEDHEFAVEGLGSNHEGLADNLLVVTP